MKKVLKNCFVLLMGGLFVLFACKAPVSTIAKEEMKTEATKVNVLKDYDDIEETKQAEERLRSVSTSVAAVPEALVMSPNGSQIYTQTITDGGPGFYHYVRKGQDFGWKHSFPDYNKDGLCILSVELIIKAFDVDSEPFHGQNGEYDRVSVDGTPLNPGFLQGQDNTWSETTFNVPLSALLDDGVVNVWLEIDINTNGGWVTKLESSTLKVTYLYVPGNHPPYKPELKASNDGRASVGTDLVVDVTGPTPPDPDEGDTVTYSYRWFVDVGQGHFVDAEFAGLGNFTGNTIPGSVLKEGQRWLVQVLPTDSHGFIGEYAEIGWEPVIPNQPPIANAGEDITVEQETFDGTQVLLSGKNSTDPENDELIYSWTWDGGSAEGMEVSHLFPHGTTEVRLTVTEKVLGKSSTDTVLVTVQDTTAPKIYACQNSCYQWCCLNNQSYLYIGKITVKDKADPNVTVTAKATQYCGFPYYRNYEIPAYIDKDTGRLYVRAYSYIYYEFDISIEAVDSSGNKSETTFSF